MNKYARIKRLKTAHKGKKPNPGFSPQINMKSSNSIQPAPWQRWSVIKMPTDSYLAAALHPWHTIDLATVEVTTAVHCTQPHTDLNMWWEMKIEQIFTKKGQETRFEIRWQEI